MNLESFLNELRAARAEGVVFVLNQDRIRALGPVPHARRCPLEVVCFRVTRRAVHAFMVAGLIEMDRSLAEDIMWVSDADRSPWSRDLRAKLLEACGLAEQAPMP